MTDLATWIATVAGGGGVLVAIAGGVLYITKEAIAKAVNQAGLREIERLKGELAGQLEKERQAFSRELERERQDAARHLESFKADLAQQTETRREVLARDLESQRAGTQRLLESLKAELTFDAELRRQAAGRKLAALSKVADTIQAMVDVVYRLQNRGSAKQREVAIEVFRNALRAALLFLDPSEIAAIEAFGREVDTAHGYFCAEEIGGAEAHTVELVVRGEAARDRLLALLRREIGVTASQRVPATLGKE